ncbi:MAG: hypothetical protein K0U98_00995 [Deltaproteobacteria bacterium]|nr:hypothetical protein [Deltaproteobacteria bacterium]
MEPRRIILLGASNIAFAFPSLVTKLRASFSGPLEIVGAFGHGRSYGLESQAGFRRLPSIIHCGLWPYLQSRPEVPCQALLMDVGNDLLYGPSLEEISGWVETCLGRLRDLGSSTSLVQMPRESVAVLPPWRYRLVRQLLYPHCRKPLEQIRDECRVLDDQLRHLAGLFGARSVEARGHWYGLDPVHLRPLAQKGAWREILSAWPAPAQAEAHPSLGERWQLWRLRPQERWSFGHHQLTPQPCHQEAPGQDVVGQEAQGQERAALTISLF